MSSVWLWSEQSWTEFVYLERSLLTWERFAPPVAFEYGGPGKAPFVSALLWVFLLRNLREHSDHRSKYESEQLIGVQHAEPT